MSHANDPTPPPSISGGCLCGAVRYTAEIGQKYEWPPGPHTCSCTHCRKHTGAPFALFLTFTRKQLGWPSHGAGIQGSSKTSSGDAPIQSTASGDISSVRLADMPIAEYSHTPGRYRGFCSVCGSTLYWRCPDEDGDEIEMCVGTVDEELLEKYGRALCEPTRARFYAPREIHGVGFGGEFKVGGPRFTRGSRSERLD